jgi:hypothetical protein
LVFWIENQCGVLLVPETLEECAMLQFLGGER